MCIHHEGSVGVNPWPSVSSEGQGKRPVGVFTLSMLSKSLGTTFTRGCAGVHRNNHIWDGHRLSLEILRPGDSQRQPVPPFEAADVWAAHPSEVLFQQAKPGL